MGRSEAVGGIEGTDISLGTVSAGRARKAKLADAGFGEFLEGS
jgi:hypothetical protein